MNCAVAKLMASVWGEVPYCYHTDCHKVQIMCGDNHSPLENLDNVCDSVRWRRHSRHMWLIITLIHPYHHFLLLMYDIIIIMALSFLAMAQASIALRG